VNALPAQRAGASLVEADLWEADALEAIEAVTTPEAAEELLGRIKLAAQAIRLSKLGAEREQRWGRIRLLGERRYGELLGPAVIGGTGANQHTSSVTSGNAATSAERKAQHEAREVAAVPEPTFIEYVDTEPAPTRAGLLREVGKGAHVSNNSGDNEWYTPAEYLTAARNVMGGIDLDPASNPVANELVGASDFYTADDDGRAKNWAGRVWMNPPYARPLIDDFAKKLADSYAAGGVTEACVLTNNATETGWFHALGNVASALCLPRRRVRFWHPDKDNAAPLQGQAVMYLGPNVDAFRREFQPFGLLLVTP
jgi:hypothetical protein